MLGYLPLVILVVVLAVVIAVVAAVRRARKAGTAMPIVQIALTISAAWAALTLLGGLLITVLWFTPNTYPYFTLRTQPYWPADAEVTGPGLDPGDLTKVYGGFTEAQVTASGLSIPTRVTLAAGDLVGSLVVAALAALIALACFRFLQGRPFAPEIARLTLVAGVVCLVGGIATQLLHQFGGSAATTEIIRAGSAPDGLVVASGISIDFWPVFLAIGLGAASALFHYGSSLQRETEGLV